jgi:hypothetical protein
MKVLTGLMLVSVLASPLSAQDTTLLTTDSTDRPVTPLYRDPKRAVILGSVIPGAGHIYAGEYVKGFFIYEATVGGIGAGAMTFIWDRCMLSFLSTTPCKSGPQWPHRVLGVALVGAGIWEWISSARDAAHAAQRANAKQLRHKLTAAPIIGAPVDSHTGWRVGTEIHF